MFFTSDKNLIWSMKIPYFTIYYFYKVVLFKSRNANPINKYTLTMYINENDKQLKCFSMLQRPVLKLYSGQEIKLLVLCW